MGDPKDVPDTFSAGIDAAVAECLLAAMQWERDHPAAALAARMLAERIGWLSRTNKTQV